MVQRRLSVVVALSVFAATVHLSSAQQLTQRDADSLAKKISAIVARGTATPAPKTALRTAVSEREINAYLKFTYREQLPPGVTDPTLTLTGNQRVSGRAIVNLDAVRTAQERSWLDPAAYLTGSLEIQAVG